MMPGPRREAGFSLIELMVASALLSLVILTAGGILISTITTGARVNAVSAATTNAQLVGVNIDTGILSSSGFEVTPVGADQLVVARVAGGASTVNWTCRAWYYSAAGDGSIRTTTSVPGTPITAPTALQLESWVLLLEGVEPRDIAVFAQDGDTLLVSFDALIDDNPPVAIEFNSSPLAGVTENSSCY